MDNVAGTSVNASDMITRRFSDELQRGDQDGKNNAKEQVDHIALKSPVSKVLMSRIRVRRVRQESTNTDRRSRDTDGENILESSIDIAVYLSVPPIRRVRVRPYD